MVVYDSQLQIRFAYRKHLDEMAQSWKLSICFRYLTGD